MEILNVKNLTIRFGGVVAVNDVSFTLEKGQTLGVIGPNGSGKTTLFNMAMENATFELSEEAIEYEAQRIINNIEYAYQYYYQVDLETILPYTEFKDMDGLNAYAEEYGKGNAQTEALVRAIFTAEDMELTDDDIAVIAELYSMTSEELIETYGEEDVNSSARIQKVLNFIYDNAIAE